MKTMRIQAAAKPTPSANESRAQTAPPSGTGTPGNVASSGAPSRARTGSRKTSADGMTITAAAHSRMPRLSASRLAR